MRKTLIVLFTSLTVLLFVAPDKGYTVPFMTGHAEYFSLSDSNYLEATVVVEVYNPGDYDGELPADFTLLGHDYLYLYSIVNEGEDPLSTFSIGNPDGLTISDASPPLGSSFPMTYISSNSIMLYIMGAVDSAVLYVASPFVPGFQTSSVVSGGGTTPMLLYGPSSPVPEPATLLLIGSGLIGLAMFSKIRRKRDSA